MKQNVFCPLPEFIELMNYRIFPSPKLGRGREICVPEPQSGE